MKIIPDAQDTIDCYIFWVFAGLCLLQIIYTLLFFGRLAYWKIPEASQSLPTVSIVISARNEYDNLSENLPKILGQHYPDFEVVVVNHQSVDDSKHLLATLQQDYRNLVVVEVERSRHMLSSKKLPLTMGIKKAKNEHLLLTDADCCPSGTDWLRSMAGQFTEKKQIVLGYGPYKEQEGFLNKVIRFDTAMIAVHYFSFAINRTPYMGVGRNLAYTKEAFNSTHGFKSHYAVASGDDDLFIQEAARKNNYTIQLSPESFMYSEAKSTWEDWTLQKARHYTTAPRYRVFKKALLGIYPLTALLMLVSFVLLMLEPDWRIHAGAGLGLVILLKWWLLGKCFSRLQSGGFIALLPFLDVMYVLISPFFYYSTVQKRASTWR